MAALSPQSDNEAMQSLFSRGARWVGAIAAALVVACSPTFNWREVPAEGAGLVALLPCKPDRASRPVTLAGQTAEVQVMGCDAGGATFAVSRMHLTDPAAAAAVLAQWREVTLRNMQAASAREGAFLPKGATALPGSVQVVAIGRRADGLPVMAHAAWFAREADVYHAVVYADRLSPEVAETFFSGLALR
jgi:hypothetical protein